MPERRSRRIAGECAAPIEIIDSDDEDEEETKLKAMDKAAELEEDIEAAEQALQAAKGRLHEHERKSKLPSTAPSEKSEGVDDEKKKKKLKHDYGVYMENFGGRLHKTVYSGEAEDVSLVLEACKKNGGLKNALRNLEMQLGGYLRLDIVQVSTPCRTTCKC